VVFLSKKLVTRSFGPNLCSNKIIFSADLFADVIGLGDGGIERGVDKIG